MEGNKEPHTVPKNTSSSTLSDLISKCAALIEVPQGSDDATYLKKNYRLSFQESKKNFFSRPKNTSFEDLSFSHTTNLFLIKIKKKSGEDPKAAQRKKAFVVSLSIVSASIALAVIYYLYTEKQKKSATNKQKNMNTSTKEITYNDSYTYDIKDQQKEVAVSDSVIPEQSDEGILA